MKSTLQDLPKDLILEALNTVSFGQGIRMAEQSRFFRSLVH